MGLSSKGIGSASSIGFGYSSGTTSSIKNLGIDSPSKVGDYTNSYMEPVNSVKAQNQEVEEVDLDTTPANASEIINTKYKSISPSETDDTFNRIAAWINQASDILNNILKGTIGKEIASSLLKIIYFFSKTDEDGIILNLKDGSTITINGSKTIFQDNITGNKYIFEGQYCIAIERNDQNVRINISYDENGNVASYELDAIDPYIFSEKNYYNGQFGGEQGSLKDAKFLQDPIVLGIMKKYFPDLDVEKDKEDMQFYFSALSSVGCGYTAYTNYIFRLYQERGWEDKFEETFGYPMYTVTPDGIDYNYEYILLDAFNYTWANQGYTIQELYGNISINAEDGARKWDGSTKIVEGTYTSEDYSYVYNSDSGSSITTLNQWLFAMTGLSYQRDFYSMEKGIKKRYFPGSEGWEKLADELLSSPEIRKEYYEQGKPLYQTTNYYELSQEEKIAFFKEQMEKGFVDITAIDFQMIQLDGKPLYDTSNVGCHALSLIDIAEDGLIVSSWGLRYLLPWSELDKIREINVMYLRN